MLGVCMLAVLICACSEQPEAEPVEAAPPEFVGSENCVSCHRGEFELWQGSHHQLAMQVASPESVLGRFDGTSVPYFETSASFSVEDGGFRVSTGNKNGDKQTFEITHTFGVTPLQQYLVDAPGGRKQALQFAWDSRPEGNGGQRWYHLYPDEFIDHDDPLHWTGHFFNWNYMCAECHSTNVEMNYDIELDTFNTTFSEVSVGCEACHGPASNHVIQADAEQFDNARGFLVDLDDHDGATWVMNPDTGIAERSQTVASLQQPESCGRCHSRRSIVAPEYEYGRPLADTHMPSLLDENLYHADGRIQDEVYVYGSFIQSKMQAAGVTCSDCHNPHSGRLHAGPEPNDTCATCHLSARFAFDEHPGNGDCVTCHMPETTYMGIDPRRDHSFRLPGTSADPDHYGTFIAAGRAGNANDKLLAGIANPEFPAIARATMLTLLEPDARVETHDAIARQVEDPDPLVRIAALRALRNQSPEVRMHHGSELLRDPVRSVRIEAALTYVDFRDLLELNDARAFNASAGEYRRSMRAAAMMPDAALNLADFEMRLGNTREAGELFEHAIRVGSDSAMVQHAYGLHLVRSGDSARAIEHLRLATEIDDSAPRFAYVYGVALNSLGSTKDAIDVLVNARQTFPDDFEIGWALATMYRDIGEREAALVVARGLAAAHPDNESIASLIASLLEQH